MWWLCDIIKLSFENEPKSLYLAYYTTLDIILIKELIFQIKI